MSHLEITIKGPPAVKKNQQQMALNPRTGKYFPVQSKTHKAYVRHALKQLQQWGNVHIPGEVQVTTVYYLPDKRKRDLTNLMACTHDLLEKSGLIEDDSLIMSVDGSRKFLDRENPRVEIVITEWEG